MDTKIGHVDVDWLLASDDPILDTFEFQGKRYLYSHRFLFELDHGNLREVQVMFDYEEEPTEDA